MRRIGLLLLLVSTACSAGGDERPTIVASVYPLAWVAERVAGPGWEVIDLTPPGAEAHDIELTLEQRAQIQDADVLFHLGQVGFQPQVETAAAETPAEVVAVDEVVDLATGHAHEEEEEGADDHGETLDPHVWLDPVRFGEVVDAIAAALAAVEPSDRGAVEETAARVHRLLADLDAEYDAALEACASRTIVVSHEAFGYLAERYGLEQAGLAELSPEAEPTVEALGEAGELLASGEALAIFYESTSESEALARTVAADTGVEALPLHTLESRPSGGDYVSVMEQNLESLREGLGCR